MLHSDKIEIMKKKNITIEDLAMMVQRGFGETAKKGEVNERFNQMENRLEDIQLKLDQVAYRFEIEELNRRLKRVESKLGLK